MNDIHPLRVLEVKTQGKKDHKKPKNKNDKLLFISQSSVLTST